MLLLASAAPVSLIFKWAILIFDITNSQFPSRFVTEWKTMELKFNQSCSGAVFLYSEGRRRAVPKYKWTANEGRRLCSDLQCGNFMNATERKAVALWNSSISCTGVENARSIWDCENNTAPTGWEQQQQQQLVIECEGKNKTKQYLSITEAIA